MEDKNKELHDIFKGIANRDETQFNKLYKNYKSLVYAVVFSMLKNEEDSEEVVQIIFSKIWNMKISNLPTDKEKTWLYNVTKNETINFLRKQKKALNIDDVYYIDERNEELNNIIDKEYYNKILSKLTTNEKEIVSLKILASLSFKEISQILNMPIGTVQWKYYKSLNTLKMLISNLTMFILTFTIYIKQRNSIKKLSKNNEETINQNKNEEQLQKEDTTEQPQVPEKTDDTQATSKIENAIAQDIEKKNQDSTQRGEITQTPTTEKSNEILEGSTSNVKLENSTLESENESHNVITEDTKTNNTLIYISSIFLIITIIFSAIWIKQKLHKSTKKPK